MVLMSLGFSGLPLLVIIALEGVWCVSLLLPPPLNAPAIELAKYSYRSIGSTIVYTLTSVLSILSLSPLYDLYRLNQATTKSPTELTSVQETLQASEGLQAHTELNLILTFVAMGALHFTRILGSTMAELERMRLSEGALLSQVERYQQQHEQVGGLAAEPAGVGMDKVTGAQVGGGAANVEGTNVSSEPKKEL